MRNHVRKQVKSTSEQLSMLRQLYDKSLGTPTEECRPSTVSSSPLYDAIEMAGNFVTENLKCWRGQSEKVLATENNEGGTGDLFSWIASLPGAFSFDINHTFNEDEEIFEKNNPDVVKQFTEYLREESPAEMQVTTGSGIRQKNLVFAETHLLPHPNTIALNKLISELDQPALKSVPISIYFEFLLEDNLYRIGQPPNQQILTTQQIIDQYLATDEATYTEAMKTVVNSMRRGGNGGGSSKDIMGIMETVKRKCNEGYQIKVYCAEDIKTYFNTHSWSGNYAPNKDRLKIFNQGLIRRMKGNSNGINLALCGDSHAFPLKIPHSQYDLKKQLNATIINKECRDYSGFVSGSTEQGTGGVTEFISTQVAIKSNDLTSNGNFKDWVKTDALLKTKFDELTKQACVDQLYTDLENGDSSAWFNKKIEIKAPEIKCLKLPLEICSLLNKWSNRTCKGKRNLKVDKARVVCQAIEEALKFTIESSPGHSLIKQKIFNYKLQELLQEPSNRSILEKKRYFQYSCSATASIKAVKRLCSFSELKRNNILKDAVDTDETLNLTILTELLPPLDDTVVRVSGPGEAPDTPCPSRSGA